MLGGRIKIIVEATGCDEATAKRLEEIMRDVIFHSTLDWQTKEQLADAARQAHAVYKELEGSGDEWAEYSPA